MMQMNPKFFLVAGALAGLLGVALGAFGAHGLKSRVAADMLAVWGTGVQYHMYHALALLAVGWLLSQWPASSAFRWSGGLFLIGILLFSGSLYTLVLTGVRGLGALAPIGGLAFMGGWLALAWGAYQQ